MSKWITIEAKDGRNPNKEEYWNSQENLYNTFLIAFKKNGIINHGFGLFNGKEWTSTRLEKLNSVVAWKPFQKYKEPVCENKTTEPNVKEHSKKKTIYIIGTPTNEKSFLLAKNALEGNGLKCICSYNMGFNERIEKLIHSDYVLLLPGYEDDFMAKYECMIAEESNIPILDNSLSTLKDIERKKPLVYLSGNCESKVILDAIKSTLTENDFEFCFCKKNDDCPIPWLILEEEINKVLSKCDYILFLPEKDYPSEYEKEYAKAMGIPTIRVKINI